jgi:hypothetical protein
MNYKDHHARKSVQNRAKRGLSDTTCKESRDSRFIVPRPFLSLLRHNHNHNHRTATSETWGTKPAQKARPKTSRRRDL